MLDSKMKIQNITDCMLKGCKRTPKQSINLYCNVFGFSPPVPLTPL